MGMFDSVDYRASCPLCGAEIDSAEWQSKSGPRDLQTLSPDGLMDHVVADRQRRPTSLAAEEHARINFYSDCPGCEAWVEITVTRYAHRPDKKGSRP